ncbi:hypothetical protein DFJ74DRAFT_701485 [Hyaloraphidium curvatum]|nr:hypothetical protein DFJ74DRAFT_701485 [Hyaloraphidium curvatum]
MAAFSEAEWAAILPLRTAEEDGAGAVKLGSRAWTLSPTPPLPPGGASDLSSFPALARNAQVDAAFVTRPAQRLLAVCQITMLGCMAALLAFAWLANAALDSPRYSTTALATGCAVFIFDAIGTFAVFVRAVGIAERKPDLAETFPQRPTDGHLAAASYIHSRLSERWTSAAADVSRSRVVLSLLFGVWVVDCIVYASVSGCIPAWPLASATCVVITLFLDLAMVATINSGPERASKLYTDAAVAASEWALAARRMGDTELAAEASDFASVARGYAGISAARARMFGVPVDWSLLGRLVVTGMTVVIGMWTLLRGAGVVFVLDTFCPLQA